MNPALSLPLLLALSAPPIPPNGDPAVPADPPAARAADPVESPEARAIADRVIAKYSNARTYRETGRGTMSLGPAGPQTQFEFRTAFRREGGMLWSFTRSMPQGPSWTSTVWSGDGKEWSAWRSFRGTVERTNERSMAFGPAAGISSGLSMIVPVLLGMDGEASDFFARFDGLRIAGKEEVGGVPCEILEGRAFGDNGTLSVWIDATGAVRKHRSQTVVDPSKEPIPPSIPEDAAARMRARPKFDSITEFTFDPVFDAEVTEQDLSFTPPAK